MKNLHFLLRTNSGCVAVIKERNENRSKMVSEQTYVNATIKETTEYTRNGKPLTVAEKKLIKEAGGSLSNFKTVVHTNKNNQINLATQFKGFDHITCVIHSSGINIIVNVQKMSVLIGNKTNDTKITFTKFISFDLSMAEFQESIDCLMEVTIPSFVKFLYNNPSYLHHLLSNRPSEIIRQYKRIHEKLIGLDLEFTEKNIINNLKLNNNQIEQKWIKVLLQLKTGSNNDRILKILKYPKSSMFNRDTCFIIPSNMDRLAAIKM